MLKTNSFEKKTLKIPANRRNFFTRYLQGPVATTLFLPFFASLSTDHAFSDKNVQKLIHDENAKFDLVINHETYHDNFLMLAHLFKAPSVSICKSSDPLDRIVLLELETVYLFIEFFPFSN